MRAHLVIVVVIAAHCIAVGSAILIQGCGTIPVEEVRIDPVPVVPSEGVDVAAPEVFHAPEVFRAPEVSPIDVPSRALTAETIVYVVKKGDSLSRIAVKHGLSSVEIMALNKIKDPNRIIVGQKLVLPAVGGRSSSPARVVAAKPIKRVAGAGGYIVKSGDCLSGIAVAHGTTVAELRAANGIKGDVIYAGKEIVIPQGERRSPSVKNIQPVLGRRVDRKDVIPMKDDLLDEMPPLPVMSHKPPVMSHRRPAVNVKMRKITVRANEDMSIIARRWAVSVDDLKRINSLGNAPLVEGQILDIPLEY